MTSREDWVGYYEEVAERSDGTQMDYSTRRRQQEEWLIMLQLAGRVDGMRVCDAGCGLGGLIPLILALEPREVWAFDQVRPIMQDVQKRHAHDERVHTRWEGVLGAADQSWAKPGFDLVLSAEVVHYVGIKRGVEALWKLVRPGGRLVMGTMSHANSPIGNPPGCEHDTISHTELEQLVGSLPGLDHHALAALKVVEPRDQQTWGVFSRHWVSPEQADGFVVAATKAAASDD